MMDYEKKYTDLISGLNKCIPDITDEFPDATGFEKAVISMRRNGWSYEGIQKKLGMPSKKMIRNALLKWAPELIDNSKSKIIKISEWESELYNILAHTNKTSFEFEDEDWKFIIINHTINYEDPYGFTGLYHDLNEIMQKQILISIKNQINDKNC